MITLNGKDYIVGWCKSCKWCHIENNNLSIFIEKKINCEYCGRSIFIYNPVGPIDADLFLKQEGWINKCIDSRVPLKTINKFLKENQTRLYIELLL